MSRTNEARSEQSGDDGIHFGEFSEATKGGRASLVEKPSGAILSERGFSLNTKCEGFDREGGNRMSNYKRKIAGWMGVGLMALGMALTTGRMSQVEAAATGTISIRVTANSAVSIAIGTATYGWGSTFAPNESRISTGAFPVQNDSSGLTEDFQINSANSANWSIASTNTGTNNFALNVLISSQGAFAGGTSPTDANFNGQVTSVAVALASLSPTYSVYATSGGDVASGAFRELHFKFAAPANISAGNNTQQTVTVTLTAADSSTF